MERFATEIFLRGAGGPCLCPGWRLVGVPGVTRPTPGHGWSSPSAAARSRSRLALPTSPRVTWAGWLPARG